MGKYAIDRRTLLLVFGSGTIGTTVNAGTGVASQSSLQSEPTKNTIQYDWEDGTKQGWEKIEVRNGQKYRYGFSGHVYEFTIDDDSIAGNYSPQIQCLNDGIYVQSPDIDSKLSGAVQAVSATFRLTGDLDASDWNNNRFRVNDANGDRNGYVRFDHEDMVLEWRGGESEQLQPFEEGTEYDITIAAESDNTFLVTVNGNTYSDLKPYEDQEVSIHTVEMRSRNWGGSGPSRYEDSIYFTWDNFEATSESSNGRDTGDDGRVTDMYEDFEQGLDDWEVNGDVSTQERGIVTDNVAKITDSEDGDGSTGRIGWQAAGEVSTHDEFEIQGVYQAVIDTAYNYRFGIQGEDRVILKIDPSSDAIGFGTTTWTSVSGETIDDAFIGEWVEFRIRFDGEGTAKAKVWPYETSEPNDWQISSEIDNETGTIVASSGQNNHGRELLVDEIEVVSIQDEDEPIDETGSITGFVTDSEDTSLSDATVQIIEDDDSVAETTTNESGEYELTEVPIGTFQLEATKPGYETATTEITVEEDTTQTESLELAIETKLEEFREQKREIAEHLETISVSDIEEKGAVEALFDEYESLLADDEVETEQAEEAVERLIMAEEVITRALVVTGQSAPRDEEADDYNMATQTYASLFQGIVEWKFGIKEIKQSLAELTGFKQIISSALDYLIDAVEDLIVEQTVGFMKDEVDAIEQEAIELAQQAVATYELAADVASGDIHSIVEELVDPVAEQFGSSSQQNLEEDGSSNLLAESSPGYRKQTELSIENTTAAVWADDATYENSLDGASINRNNGLRRINQNAADLEDSMTREHEGLLDLIDIVLDLKRAGLSETWSVLQELAAFIWDRLPIVRQGFNTGQGIVLVESVVDESYESVDSIVGRESV